MQFIKRPWAVVISPWPELLAMVFWTQGQAVEVRPWFPFVMDFYRVRAAD